MSDLINRQDAIDALEGEIEVVGKANAKAVLKYTKMVCDRIKALPSVQPEPRWIPVKTRPMTEEERQEWSEALDYDIEYEDAVIFDCKMPEDGQEILVSYRKWINMDKCEIDDGVYGLEGMGDWGDVIAWMPLPEPYREEKEDD